MAKKLFGLSVFLWIMIALVVLFFVYGVGRKEGFKAAKAAKTVNCGSKKNKDSCTSIGCSWSGTSNSEGTCS